MRCLMALAAACVLVGWISAPAAQAGPREDCAKWEENPDLAIQACTTLIRRSPRDALAFMNRGNAYSKKEDDARAHEDYSEVIKLKPRYAWAAKAYQTLGRDKWLDGEYDDAIADYNEAIRLDPSNADAHRGRGNAYYSKGEYDRAISDYNEAIRLNPADPHAHSWRGGAYRRKLDYDRAIADYSEAIRLNPSAGHAYTERAETYAQKGDYDRAITDYGEAIRIFKRAFWVGRVIIERGRLYAKKRDYDHAIADAIAAIGKSATNSRWYHLRGEAYRATQQYDQAIADFDKAIALYSESLPSFASRGKAYEEKGERSKAIEDYNKALALEPSGGAAKGYNSKSLQWLAALEEEKEYQAKARQWLAALQATPQAPPVASPSPAPVAVVPAPPLTSAAPGRRVALVIGNSAYKAVPALLNPKKDARDVAAALRDAGFAEVVEHHDLGLAAMRTTLSAFEYLAKTADWAVVYYAGHGIEVDGRNYLMPVDAQLKRDSDVEDEALPLERVLTRVSVAKKLQLVILDACRDNPFARKMASSGGFKRSIGARGLARFENLPTNLMIAYSAGKGEAALDGAAGENSPYAKALVKYLAEPQLELGIFFRKVRADVLEATQGKQRPFEDSSLTDVNLFLRNAAK